MEGDDTSDSSGFIISSFIQPVLRQFLRINILEGFSWFSLSLGICGIVF